MSLSPDCLTTKGTLAISQSQIANAPTVERPQGVWIKQYNKSYELKTNEGILVGEFTKCSKCQYDKARGSNFCPNCGAEMRGKMNDLGADK